MKKIALLFLSFISVSLFAQESKLEKKETSAELKFETISHDFGDIKEGTIATYEFKFMNTGTDTLIIENVKASCGCTTPEWPKNPIPPQGEGKIKAIYKSNKNPGNFNKTLTVKSNAKSAIIHLTIKGNILTIPPDPVSPMRNQY